MFSSVIKSFFLTIFIVTPVFAYEELSNFHKQGDLNYPEPIGEEAYFAAQAPLPAKSSWYLGLNLGGGLASLKSEISIDSQITSKKKDALGSNVGIYTGYGVNLSQFYFGGEVNLGADFVSKNIKANDTELKVKQPLIMSFDLMPGLMNYSRNVLLYGRLGVIASLFKLDFEHFVDEVENSKDKIAFGFRGGVGIEYFMSDTFSVRAEYVYNRYGKVSNTYKGAKEYIYKLKSSNCHLLNLGFSIHI